MFKYASPFLTIEWSRDDNIKKIKGLPLLKPTEFDNFAKARLGNSLG